MHDVALYANDTQ